MNAERKARSTGKRESPAAVSSVFFALSFLGWCMETVYCSDFFTKFPDRGFLTLPFCVIYGAPPCLARLLFGTPREGRLARAADKAGLNGAGSILFRYGSYFLLSAGTATLFELSFGALFDAFGVRLWNYSRRPLNFRGYICPQFSLLWGTLITCFMSFAWNPSVRIASRIPRKIAAAVNLFLWIAVAADCSFHFAWLAVCRRRFRFSDLFA